MENSNSRIKLLLKVYVPSLHQITVLSFTKVIGFRAAGMELHWHLLKETELQLFRSVVARTTLFAIFYFVSFSIMIIIGLIFSFIAEYTFVCFWMSMLTSSAATAWYDLIRWKRNSSGFITYHRSLPSVGLSSFSILVAFAYQSSSLFFSISNVRAGHVFSCAGLPGKARISSIRV